MSSSSLPLEDRGATKTMILTYQTVCYLAHVVAQVSMLRSFIDQLIIMILTYIHTPNQYIAVLPLGTPTALANGF